MKEKVIFELFMKMFRPTTYSVASAQKMLEEYGGILCLLNDLRTNHREGLPSYDKADHEARANNYGRNSLPPGESLLKKSISEERDFMVNLLFYLLTLRICVKLLLVRDQYFQVEGQQFLPDNHYQLSIYDEFISYTLLIIMIFLKAMVNIEYFHMDKDERKYKNEIITVKRDGELEQIQQKELLVGDILITQPNRIIRVDGIILYAKKFMISEALTILRQDSKIKSQIWEQKPDSDPFILAGSAVVTGEAEVLVCTVGESCSFRAEEDQLMESFEETPPLINQLQKFLQITQNIAKVLCVLLPTWLCAQYVYEQSQKEKIEFNWLDFIWILKIYCSFIGLICFLQRLKIVKSIKFFMEGHVSGKFFRVINKKTLEKLSSLDILFIEWESIAIREREEREEKLYELDHVSEISEINNYYNVKIITKEDKETVKAIFGNDISESGFFEPNEQLPYSEYIRQLMKATFITKSSLKILLNRYIPIFKAINCEIGYVSSSLSPLLKQIPEDILLIAFHRLQYTHDFQPIIQKENITSGCWIKLQNKMVMEDVLQEIIQQSFLYAHLFNTYCSLLINNMIVFLMFCLFSFLKKPVSLYFSLTIIIANRYLFFTVYRRIALETREASQRRISIFQFCKINVLLLPYYLYVTLNLNLISNFFIFFLVNSLLRIETVLFKFDRVKSMKLLAQYTGLVIVLNIVNVYLVDQNLYNQQLQNLGYIFGLTLFMFIYAPLT